MNFLWKQLPQTSVETDPRFPSGRWTGFWIQSGFGRSYMSIELKFVNGAVSGRGFDCIGEFVMSGSYETASGACRITKSYISQHSVCYEGKNEDDGMWIWGLWNIPSVDRGGFHIWPEKEQDPTRRRARTEQHIPQTVEEPHLKREPTGAGA
jgi:hypothetical protein